MGLAFPVVPLAALVLGAATLLIARKKGLQKVPSMVLRPSWRVRGLSAAAFWSSVVLTGYFALYLPLGMSQTNAVVSALLLMPAALLSVCLLVIYAAILAGVLRSRGSAEPVVGRELVLAYCTTFLGDSAPASIILWILWLNLKGPMSL